MTNRPDGYLSTREFLDQANARRPAGTKPLSRRTLTRMITGDGQPQTVRPGRRVDYVQPAELDRFMRTYEWKSDAGRR